MFLVFPLINCKLTVPAKHNARYCYIDLYYKEKGIVHILANHTEYMNQSHFKAWIEKHLCTLQLLTAASHPTITTINDFKMCAG